MPKTIVTHVNPDLDAITSVWLLTRFGGKDFSVARIAFVPAGERLPDEDNNTVHVDTGLGEFDHHQEQRGKENTCSAKLIYGWLVAKKRISQNEALVRLVALVNDIDHFRECFWPEPDHDRYAMFLEEMLGGLKLGGHLRSDHELLELGMLCLDGVYVALRNKLSALKEFETGITFETQWGKTLAVETGNDAVMKLTLKRGYAVVVRRDPENGAIRIKADPSGEIDLTPVYDSLRKKDPQATWFFHASKRMILNGSTRNPKMRPSKLTLEEVIGILKSV